MRSRFEDLQVYLLAERLADEVWVSVARWDYFARDTVGKQLVRAADSVGANIAEGTGRDTYADNHRFIGYARGSLLETKHFLRRAHRRGLLSHADVTRIQPCLNELLPRLGAYRRAVARAQSLSRASKSTQPPSTNH